MNTISDDTTAVADAQCARLVQSLEHFDISQASPQARQQVLDTMWKFTRLVETPWDAIGRMFWIEPSAVMATKMAVDMGLFQRLNEANPPVASHAQLASSVGADAAFVRRVLRTLSANGIVHEVGVDQYTTNSLSKTLVSPEAASTITYLAEVQLPCSIGVPAWIRAHNFRNPSGPDDCPWKDTMKTDKSYFQWLKAHPDRLRQFGAFMKGFNESRIEWTDFFHIADIFDAGGKSPFVVDVGGGVGHDLMQILRKLPAAAGRLHLQDLPEVIQQASVPEPQISKAAHDFFTPQPVKGARVYLLHSILHDWPNFEARDILNQLVPAMKKGYSKILLLESAISLQDPSPGSTGVDFLMMSIFGAQERDENEWKSLLESAGLSLTKIWRSPAGGQAIIEVELSERFDPSQL